MPVPQEVGEPIAGLGGAGRRQKSFFVLNEFFDLREIPKVVHDQNRICSGPLQVSPKEVSALNPEAAASNRYCMGSTITRR